MPWLAWKAVGRTLPSSSPGATRGTLRALLCLSHRAEMLRGLGLPQPWVGRSQVPGEKLGHHSGCLELWGFRQGSARGELEFTNLWPPRKRRLRVGEASGGIVGGGRGARVLGCGHTLLREPTAPVGRRDFGVGKRDAWRDLTRAAEAGGEVPSDCAGHCLAMSFGCCASRWDW